jgi:hypothetical protein
MCQADAEPSRGRKMKGTLQADMMSVKVDVLEILNTPPLSNGVKVWCGRLSVPSQMSVSLGAVYFLTLDDGRSGQAKIQKRTANDLAFYGIMA